MDEEELYEAMGLEIPAHDGDGVGSGGTDGEREHPLTDTDTVSEDQLPQASAEGGAEEVPASEGETDGQLPETPDPIGGEGQNQEEAVHQDSGAAQAQFEAPGEDQRTRDAVDAAYRAAFAGKLNPYTGRPITGRADFEEYQTQLREDQRRQQEEQMRRAGVDPEAIRGLIDQHPVVQQAQQVIRQAQAERERTQADQAKGWFTDQIRQINALDPEARLGGLEDLASREPEQYRKMLGMVGGGVSLADAYKALNFDRLAQRRAAAARQSVRNQAAGKAHLAPVAGQGKDGVEVPGGIRQMYRDLNPDMTDAQIRQEYAKYLKETQK